jgi:RNA polymerase-binding protein DksA
MNQAELESYRNTLLDLRGRLTNGINRLAEVVLADERPAGEHDQLTSEPIDKEIFLDHAEEAIRRKVIEALRRIDAGSYGQCEECNEAIAKERLEAMPYAASCIECERKKEREARPRR